MVVLQRLFDAYSRTLDDAVLRMLGTIPVPPIDHVGFSSVDVGRFWAESRVRSPAQVVAVRELGRRRNGEVRVVDVEAPSLGPGRHPGSRKLIARAHLRDRDASAPLVIVLHGFAVPVAVYDEIQLRALTQRGASAVRLDHPWHLRRRGLGMQSGEGYMIGDPARLLGSVRQSVEDAAALVAWGKTFSDHVAVMGVSLGGLVACLLSALIEVDAVVAVAPFCDPPTTLVDNLPASVRRKLVGVGEHSGAWGSTPGEAHQVLASAMAPIVARNLTPPVTPADRITLVRASNDGIVGPAPVAALAKAWNAEIWDMRHGHISVLNARGLHERIYERLLRRPAGAATTGVSPAG